MKHNLRITLLLVILFFASQIIGLAVVNEYIDHKKTTEENIVSFEPLPYSIERPPVEEKTSYIYLITAILIGTLIILILIRFKGALLWKYWFFLAVVLSLSFAFSAFTDSRIAFVLAFSLAFFKVFKPGPIIHNLTELFIYAGLAALFVPIINLFSAFMLLALISIYDMYAVWKSKHMIKLAKFQTESKVFAGLFLQYKQKKTKKQVKTGNAVLGGGDIAFPLFFAGVVMKGLMLEHTILIGFLKALIIPSVVSIALLILFLKAKKDRFYPAMPFLTIGCIIGWILTLI